VVDVRVREANNPVTTYEKRACDRQVFLARLAIGIFKAMAEQAETNLGRHRWTKGTAQSGRGKILAVREGSNVGHLVNSSKAI
jgi:hypothetical protein